MPHLSPKFSSERRRSLLLMTVFAAGAVVRPLPVLADKMMTKVFQFSIRKGKVAQDKTVVRVSMGDEVKLSWTVDKAMQLYLHGYNIMVYAQPDRVVSMSFKAHTPGRFPVAAHNFGNPILAHVEVYPQ